jgi:MFS family permease
MPLATPQFQRLALIAGVMGMLAYSLDTAATQVGLPAIQASMEMTAVASQWVFNLPIMIIAAMVGVGGWLGDRKGQVRFFFFWPMPTGSSSKPMTCRR